MRAIVFNGETAEIRDDVEVRKPGPSEVLVRVAAAGVCHSDLSVLDGTIPWPAPSVMGHEGAGIVEEVGPVVTRVKQGDHIVIATVANCGICDRCNAGKPTWCRQSIGNRTRAVHRRRRARRQLRGHVVVRGDDVIKEVQAVPIDKEVPLTSACLIACGVVTGVGSVFNRANVQPRRQHGRVRLRRRRPLHDPGAAHQGRQPHHRRRHPRRRRASSPWHSAPRTSSTPPRSTPSSRSTSCSRGRRRCPRARSAPAASTGRSSASATPPSPRRPCSVLDWGGVCVQVGVPAPGVTYAIPITHLTQVDRGIIGSRAGGVRRSATSR